MICWARCVGFSLLTFLSPPCFRLNVNYGEQVTTLKFTRQQHHTLKTGIFSVKYVKQRISCSFVLREFSSRSARCIRIESPSHFIHYSSILIIHFWSCWMHNWIVQLFTVSFHSSTALWMSEKKRNKARWENETFISFYLALSPTSLLLLCWCWVLFRHNWAEGSLRKEEKMSGRRANHVF